MESHDQNETGFFIFLSRIGTKPQGQQVVPANKKRFSGPAFDPKQES